MSFFRGRFRRRGNRYKLKPIRGRPFDNIPKWLYERTVRKKDPIGKKVRKVKEKKIKIPYLQKTLRVIIDKINEMIKWIKRIPEIERRQDELEKKQQRDVTFLLGRIEAHSILPTPLVHSPYTTAARGYRRFGEGGRTDTPHPISEGPEYTGRLYEKRRKGEYFTKPISTNQVNYTPKQQVHHYPWGTTGRNPYPARRPKASEAKPNIYHSQNPKFWANRMDDGGIINNKPISSKGQLIKVGDVVKDMNST